MFKWGMIIAGDRHTWSGDHLQNKNKAVDPGPFFLNHIILSPEKVGKV